MKDTTITITVLDNNISRFSIYTTLPNDTGTQNTIIESSGISVDSVGEEIKKILRKLILENNIK